jgi:hypothetical protein
VLWKPEVSAPDANVIQRGACSGPSGYSVGGAAGECGRAAEEEAAHVLLTDGTDSYRLAQATAGQGVMPLT